MSIFKRLTPFLVAGILIVILAFGLVLFAYIFLIGAIVGTCLFVVNWIRQRFAPPKPVKPPTPSGRIIDSDDWRKL